MATVPRQLKDSTVYYVTNRLADGTQAWEHAGTDKRAAQRRDAAMKREIKAGRYASRATQATSVAAYWRDWQRMRTCRSAHKEGQRWDRHIAPRAPWFLAMRMDDVRLADMLRLLAEVARPYEDKRTGETRELAASSLWPILSPVTTMFRHAYRTGVIDRNPCDWPRGTFSNRPKVRRKPYTFAEVVALTTDERLEPHTRVLCALLFYTGMRLGEVVGRRFRDWDRGTDPLGALYIHCQANGAPLKTDKKAAGERPRWCPVHPFLDGVLTEWWAKGFELHHCRPPTPEDWIVQSRHAGPAKQWKGRSMGKSTAYAIFIRACGKLGIEPRTVHSTRHTFVTLARRDGAKDVDLQRITHSPEGDGSILDVYTAADWDPLCAAALCFMARAPAQRARTPLLHAV